MEVLTRASVASAHIKTPHPIQILTEKPHSKHARIHTNSYILDMFLKYNWKNLHDHRFLKLYVKKHAFLEPEFIRKKHAFLEPEIVRKKHAFS